jgi:CRP-like cAMP-binding protein
MVNLLITYSLPLSGRIYGKCKYIQNDYFLMLTPLLDRPRLETQENRRLHFCRTKEDISLSSQGVWQVHNGVVQLSTISNNGDEILLGWVKPGQFFGNWFSSLEIYTATALTDVYLIWYPITEIESSLRLSQQILPQLISRIRQTKVEDRLFQLLELLKKELGQPVSDGIQISIRLTHQQIACAINSTRVTITRLLSKLEQQGYITIDDERHIIIKEQKFAKIEYLSH